MSLFSEAYIKTTPGNPYIFNKNKEPKVLYDLINDFLHVGYYNSRILTYQLRLRYNPIVDIRLISTSYSDTKIVFVEHANMYASNGINLLDFLQFFNRLNKPTKESLLNNVLKTDQDNILYSYQISNNTITFI